MKLQNETDMPQAVHGKWYEDACAAAFAMELIGERWSLLIIRELMLGPRRFSDIRAELPGLSAKVLTERLERMQEIGVLTRHRLPPPSGAQVFELTEWGRELEFVMQALGRWSVRSPLHDPNLPLTPTSFLLSLRTMIDLNRAENMDVRALFRTDTAVLEAHLKDGELAVARVSRPSADPDLTFEAASVSQFLGLLYGKRPPQECGITVSGDSDLAARFIDLFALPPKCALPMAQAGTE